MENLAPLGFESQTIQPTASNVLEYQNEIKTKFTKTLRRDTTSEILGNFPPVILFPLQKYKVWDIYFQVDNVTCHFSYTG
jgi:hypothetical protein